MTTPETFLSTRGRGFTVSIAPAGADSSASVESNDAANLGSGKEDFGISVVWKATGDGLWELNPDIVKDIASIPQYSLKTNSADSDGTKHCTLTFTNTKHYKYTFYDETGDGYENNIFLNGNHTIDYTSKKPDIVFITGS
ncbi:hypothetical protein DFH08DRAFT_967569 [Mycena albidolilacea]|uniref:Uncharacterized protein n=1 Tax=Mycena albidolilacea TaxID=1033008 RepID=A0AAD7EIK3_9AGAR|nr:hypothetical protein DFH08DRAFT_967569 [Mycena albidolilacea]